MKILANQALSECSHTVWASYAEVSDQSNLTKILWWFWYLCWVGPKPQVADFCAAVDT